MTTHHVSLSGDVAVALPPAEAFELFTPEGERRWAEGWDPKWLEPEGGALRAGAVFRTVMDSEETVWLVVDVERSKGRVRYVRDTPGSRVGTVEVRCGSGPAGGTIARVSYELTALSPAGAQIIGELEAGYREMLLEWQRDIAAALARERRAGPSA